MSEQGQRQLIVRMLRPLDAVSVENAAYFGTPDVNYIDGWLELKWLREWPKKERTVVEVEHYTPQQRAWAIRRRRRGGRCWLLLQCRRDWLLFLGEDAAYCLGKVPRDELESKALRVSNNGLDPDELIATLNMNLPFNKPDV